MKPPAEPEESEVDPVIVKPEQVQKMTVPLKIRSEAGIAKCDLTGPDGVPRPKVLFTLKDVTGEKKALWDVALARAIAVKLVECCDMCDAETPKLATVQPNRLIVPGM